jgi:hypothetical protein
MWKIVLNTRLFGKVDQVSKTCYVATEFFHIGYVPVFPTQTWLVVADSTTDALVYESWRGIPIGRSWNSILYAWIRAPLLIGALLSPTVAWLEYNTAPRGDRVPITGAELFGWIGFGCLLILSFRFTYWLSRANLNRAAEFRRMVESSQNNLTEQQSISAGS